MPIRIPNELPATKTLTEEHIFVMTETRARTQDIRPLQILLLNLMPTKIDTETQLSRLLGNTPLQVELTLLHTKTHESKNTAKEHLLAFYKVFDEIKHRNFDGMVITGAPVENLAFEEVEYWDELCEVAAVLPQLTQHGVIHNLQALWICPGNQERVNYLFPGLPWGGEGVQPEGPVTSFVCIRVFRDPLGRLLAHLFFRRQAAAFRTAP